MDIRKSKPNMEDSGEYSLITNEKCNAPRAKIFLVCVVSFIVAAVVVLIVVLTRIEVSSLQQDSDACWFSEDCNGTVNEFLPCSDIAVVGGGLAGSYVTWRLMHANASRSVDLYEASDRIGGRFHTLHLPDIDQINLEVGAAYFIPSIHPLMNRTITQLGLEVMFMLPEYSQHDGLNVLRGVGLRDSQLNTSELPYNMHDDEMYRYPYGLLRSSLTGELRTFNKSASDSQGKSLKQYLMAHVSHEAYSYLSDSVDPRDFNEDANVDLALASAFRTNLLTPLSNMAERMTLVGGMDILPRKLAYEASLKGAVQRLSHQLTGVKETEVGFRMSFDIANSNDDSVSTEHMCSKALILALPPSAIDSLAMNLKDSWLQERLQSPLEVKFITIFAIYSAAWWQSSRLTMSWRAVHSDLPIGDVIEVTPISRLTSVNISVLAISVSKQPHVDYWRGLFDPDQLNKVSPSANDVLVNHVTKHLRSLATGNDDIPNPSSMMIHQWDSDLPLSSGTSLWRPSDNWPEISPRMIQPYSEKAFYVVGSSFAPGDLQLWAEGALYTADKLMSTFLAKK